MTLLKIIKKIQYLGLQLDIYGQNPFRILEVSSLFLLIFENDGRKAKEDNREIILIDLRVWWCHFNIIKYVPVETRTQPSTCNYCSLMILSFRVSKHEGLVIAHTQCNKMITYIDF